VVNKSEYLAKAGLRKEVVLPSGLTIIIKKITGHDFIRAGNFSLHTTHQVLVESKEKNEVIWKKMSDEQKKRQIESNDRMIVQAVVSPKLSVESTDDEVLSVRDLSDEDYFALLKEVGDFSASRGQDLKPFREEPNAVDTGLTGEEVRSEAKQPA